MALKTIIKPFYKFMNRLAYSYKFGVVMLLFAIPLVVLLTQIFLSSNVELKQARQQSAGVATIIRTHELIGRLEHWRDTAVLEFVSSSPEVKAMHAEARQDVLRKIELMQGLLTEGDNGPVLNYLKELDERIRSPLIAPGMEGISIELLYDNVHRYVEDTYDWQRQVASDFGLLGVQDAGTYAVMNLVLYDSDEAYEAIGRARVYGSYFLHSGFIDSSGIYVLDKTYANLEKQIEKISGKLKNMKRAVPDTDYDHRFFIQPLLAIQALLDERLIQVIDLQDPWRDYFVQTQQYLTAARQYENGWLAIALNRFLELERQRELEMASLLTFTFGFLILILLLYTGFYYSVKKTITKLVKSAEAVAAGDLDRAMQTQTRDELSLLGKALDHMREQLKARQVYLHHMSITDGLTGLKNRKFFDEILEAETNKAVRGQYPISLILVDIDHFKSINDDYGHLVGDECLQFVAKKFKGFAKRASDVAARYGGEEFAIILPDSPVDACFEQADQFRKVIEGAEIQSEGNTIKLTVSCGVASLVPESVEAIPDLIRTADEALYEAKNAGRNCTKLKSLDGDRLIKHA